VVELLAKFIVLVFYSVIEVDVRGKINGYVRPRFRISWSAFVIAYLTSLLTVSRVLSKPSAYATS
jgi:hypothetical protein